MSSPKTGASWTSSAHEQPDALPDNPDEEVYSMILHELAHCLSFGLIWDNLGLIKGCRAPYFTGPTARLLFSALGGDGLSDAIVPVPIEASDQGHWRGTIFWDELMAKDWYYPFRQPLSAITIAQFADLGYQVDYEAADAYSVPARGAAKTRPGDEVASFNLFQGEVKEVDEKGRIVR